MIYKRGWQRTICQWELQIHLEREGIPDARKISRIICGEDDSPGHEFLLIDNSWDVGSGTTPLQRINRLWFVPIYLLTIPFQWLFRGEVGMRNESKMARIMAKLTGLQ
ncbi:hypothetical protein ACMV8I_18710 [Ewingella sp. S1.OA.A_B6]